LEEFLAGEGENSQVHGTDSKGLRENFGLWKKKIRENFRLHKRKKKYSRLGRAWSATSRLGARKSTGTFFTVDRISFCFKGLVTLNTD
jgi:hypothetical protein